MRGVRGRAFRFRRNIRQLLVPPLAKLCWAPLPSWSVAVPPGILVADVEDGARVGGAGEAVGVIRSRRLIYFVGALIDIGQAVHGIGCGAADAEGAGANFSEVVGPARGATPHGVDRADDVQRCWLGVFDADGVIQAPGVTALEIDRDLRGVFVGDVAHGVRRGDGVDRVRRAEAIEHAEVVLAS